MGLPSMTLEEYRLRLLERIKACSGPERVGDLLSEVQMMLAQASLSVDSIKNFWSSLKDNLEILEEELPSLSSDARSQRAAIITAAKQLVAARQKSPSGMLDKSGPSF
jgi:hypothetical protein